MTRSCLLPFSLEAALLIAVGVRVEHQPWHEIISYSIRSVYIVQRVRSVIFSFRMICVQLFELRRDNYILRT